MLRAAPLLLLKQRVSQNESEWVMFTLLVLSGIADFQLVAQETETDQKTVDEVKQGERRSSRS